MNTRNAYALRAKAQRGQHAAHAPYGLGTPAAIMQTRPAETAPSPGGSGLPRHALANRSMNARLAHCEDSVKGRFDAIVPVLKSLSALQHLDDFPVRAERIALERLGYPLPPATLEDAWVAGLDLKALYAYCAFQSLKAAVDQFARDIRAQLEVVQDTRNFFLDCGFHAVDISPCADGRLKGLSRYILRLPLTSLARRKAYAGALFDVETDVRHWGATELRRFREGVPTTADAGTRYLKIAVYHTSSSDPSHEGCAAHGSNETRAIEAALERLNQFRQAIENAFCCGASTDILLIGVDTDTDSIKVHVPDARGELSAYRYLDNAALYRDTLHLSADAARAAVYEAIRQTSRKEGWGAGQGEPHDGMRRLLANLLVNNFSQIEYVNDLYDGRYPDIGHAERYISVGDGFEEVQMRNVAYYAHLHTVEEGAGDMDVGIKIFKGLNVKHGLPIPIAIHYRYDAKVPGARERVAAKARRVREAIEARYPDLATQGLLACWLSVQDLPTGSPIEEVQP
ncbi:MAG TPA: carboxysome shell carbonic anhydrase [Thiobacillaceae bacterium]|nr:carboxysome shell carbonic anhydrase [Thiobacillaceae bacterium]HNF88150.1 carboxysome shell carbonic anhydrase [Thiobacillaceae bacterium]HNI06882.1 carboxysome shell carbonic anhydrase [Thiobacillaceae bacterium]